MSLSCIGSVLTLVAPLFGAEPASEPKPVPVTRPEMKQALDALKKARPRLPLPAPTEEELNKPGRLGVVNNGRMRALYLDPTLRGEFSRQADDTLTLDANFKTMLFWIVSRLNNCHYCLGHQECKLVNGGIKEDQIAALDSAWEAFTPAEQAAFALTRKLTFQPHQLTAADLDALRKHYKETQILEIVFTVAGNNGTNRWTDSLGIPQEERRELKTPTSEKYRTRATLVALRAGPGQVAAPAPPARRPGLETRRQVEDQLAAARKRTPRLPLSEEARARSVLPPDWPKEPLPEWVRLLANFPKHGVARVVSLCAAENKGQLDNVLKAQIAWIAARHDRAWYALGRAKLRLQGLGLSEAAVWALDGSWDGYRPGEQAVFAFARKLTVDPARIVDEDVAGLRKHYADKQVAEIVYHVTLAAFFNRLTEAAGLRLEEK